MTSMVKRNTCKMCGEEKDTVYEDFWRIGDKLKKELNMSVGYYCVKCLQRLWAEYTKKVEELIRGWKRARSKDVEFVNAIKKANERALRFIEEVESKGSVSLTKNIIVYQNGPKYFLKVTDYKKGYWAEEPLDWEELLSALDFFLRIAEHR